MIVREISGDADLEVWTRVRNRVEPDAPTTLEDLRNELRRQPERRLWLVEDEGEAVGCSFVGSSVPGRAFLLPRVLAEARGRGVGSALIEMGLAYARELGCEVARSHIGGGDLVSMEFAARRGYVEVDRQVELVRQLSATEPTPACPAGIELGELDPSPTDDLRALVALGAKDMPVVGGPGEGFVDVLLDELQGALYRVGAFEGGTLVGLAGLVRHGAREEALEHAFTTVLPSHRGRGIAVALKHACVRWGSEHGYTEIVTWTQQGNDAMQAVNERAGKVSITVEGALA